MSLEFSQAPQASSSLQGLLEFLAYEPFYHPREWDSIIKAPGRLGSLRQLLHGVMLRRTQADVGECLHRALTPYQQLPGSCSCSAPFE